MSSENILTHNAKNGAYLYSEYITNEKVLVDKEFVSLNIVKSSNKENAYLNIVIICGYRILILELC